MRTLPVIGPTALTQPVLSTVWILLIHIGNILAIWPKAAQYTLPILPILPMSLSMSISSLVANRWDVFLSDLESILVLGMGTQNPPCRNVGLANRGAKENVAKSNISLELKFTVRRYRRGVEGSN